MISPLYQTWINGNFRVKLESSLYGEIRFKDAKNALMNFNEEAAKMIKNNVRKLNS